MAQSKFSLKVSWEAIITDALNVTWLGLAILLKQSVGKYSGSLTGALFFSFFSSFFVCGFEETKWE